jgi:hypothetical protein
VTAAHGSRAGARAGAAPEQAHGARAAITAPAALVAAPLEPGAPPASASPQAAAPTAVPAGGSSRGSTPGGALGLAALLGIAGLAAARAGHMAPALVAIHGTGGVRIASQSLLSFAWSGRCIPAESAAASSPTLADRDVAFSAASAAGDRGGVEGALSSASPAPRGGGSLPFGLAFAQRSSGGGGPTAWIWGVCLGASAALGAVLACVTGNRSMRGGSA